MINTNGSFLCSMAMATGLDVAKVKANLAKKKFTAIVDPNHRSRSIVWELFCRIKTDQGQVLENFVVCNDCRCVMQYTTGKGTSNMLRHKCVQKKLKERSESKIRFLNDPKHRCRSIENSGTRNNIAEAIVACDFSNEVNLHQEDRVTRSGRSFCQRAKTISKPDSAQTRTENLIEKVSTRSRF